MHELEVINPRRRRRRRMSAKQRRYFGPRRRRRARRNPPVLYAAANPRRRRHRGYRVTTHSRHIRRNPFGGGFMGDLMKTIQGGAIGTVGILANNGVANTVSNLANVTDPLYRQLVKVVSALSLPTLVGMVAPQFRAMTRDAMVCALAHEGAKIAEARVLPMLGANVSGALTSGDGSGYYGPPVPGPRDDKVKGFGYLPGARDYVGYLPGKLNYVGQGNRMLTPQMVNHF